MSESPEVELISFENPTNPECRLFVPQIHWPSGSESELAEFLRERLLPHGLPHSVYVAKCTPGEYGNKLDEDDADSRSANRARVFLHDNLVVGGKACKVRRSTRTKSAAEAPLPVSKCEELANHFLGFNGWSSQLIYHRLEEVSPEDEWTYCCAVRLSFRSVPGMCVEGVGMAVASVDATKPETKAPSIAIARKQSKTAAKINAFSKVILVVVGKKVSVEIDTTKEEPFFYDPIWEEHAAVVKECEADGFEDED